MNPYIDIVLRSIAVYFFMIAALRIFGKKEISQLNTADVILILLISNSVQNAMVGNNSSLTGGLVAALILFILNYLLKKIMFTSKFFRQLIQSKPEILIHNGKIEFSSLSRLGITSDEMQEAMREHGIEYYKDVKLAMLEIDGNISIISGNENIKQTHHKRKVHKNLGTINS
ncbi:DUF421 domain-containing protein [Flavobacterium celericrescens]|uniref:DUF421 domain-containing protein n=1 Tax=Flavobacterium celericrescens TaxID=2709780 RepID=A0ABX0IFX1_9FLAO|nr:YetF domain-containing protein [Flavobacterium celericrescens]NHM05552.1 DUF421 domain-containing protein [Flavobacterium celericrescens]